MPSQSGPLQQPGAANSDLEQARSNALQTVADYRYIVISLEIKRIADSRVGTIMWEERCRCYFGARPVIRACPPIENARFRINSVFTRAAATNHVLFDRMVAHINRARSVARISALLLLMERNLTLNSEIRAIYAVAIMRRLRCDLHRIFGGSIAADNIGIRNAQERWYRTIYRMILGLRFDGLYHLNPIPVRINPNNPQSREFTYHAEYFFAFTHGAWEPNPRRIW